MQTYNEITNELTGKDLPGKVYENMQSLKSDFSGTEFPTTNLVAGMTCFRTDQNKVYRLLSDLQTWRLESDLSVEGGVSIASQAEAEAGTNNVKVMTPLRVKNAIDKQRPGKRYGYLTDLGLDDTATEKDILNAMSAGSEFAMAASMNTMPNFTLFEKGNYTTRFVFSKMNWYEWCIYATRYNGTFVASGADGTEITVDSWKQLATTDDFAPVIWQRNNYYRGKSLGTSLTTAQSNAIRNGTFDDIYVGDYWTIGGVVYRIVAIDYYYNCGDTACTTHHVVVVPDNYLYTAQMNTSNVVTGGYVGSAMYTSNLNSAKTTITNAFGSGHILTIRQLFTTATSGNIASSHAWTDATVWLMNEINVYGTYAIINVNSSEGWNAGKYTIDNCQYPAFRANPRLIHTRQTYWLRDVANSTSFAFVYTHGGAYSTGASYSHGVRPAFCVY